jgi:GNAT superfamily N-acetyltransferase
MEVFNLSGFEIVSVLDEEGLRRFVDLPYSFYRDDPFWVPQLRLAQKELFNRKKHPFYAHADMQCFLARRNGSLIGRIAAIEDRNYNSFQKEEAGFFGFFECVDDQAVASGLFGAAREWLVAKGARVIRGPVNPSTNYECGLLVEGFDSCPQIMMPFNPPYYDALIQGAGPRKAKNLYAYHVVIDQAAMDRVNRVAARAAKSNEIRIRPIRMKAFAEDVELVWKVYNSAWSRNWGFAPVSREEFMFMAHDMKSILEPELVLLGEVRGKVVAFALALPDINRALKHTDGRLLPLGLLKILYHKRSIRSMRVLVLGVIEEYRTTGVAAGFYAELFRRATRLGYRECEMSWTLEDNTLVNRSIEAVGGKRYKTYRIYEWN